MEGFVPAICLNMVKSIFIIKGNGTQITQKTLNYAD